MYFLLWSYTWKKKSAGTGRIESTGESMGQGEKPLRAIGRVTLQHQLPWGRLQWPVMARWISVIIQDHYIVNTELSCWPGLTPLAHIIFA